MQGETLVKYINRKRIELNEKLNILKDDILYGDCNETTSIKIDKAQAELDIVMDIIRICNNRGRY